MTEKPEEVLCVKCRLPESRHYPPHKFSPPAMPTASEPTPTDRKPAGNTGKV